MAVPRSSRKREAESAVPAHGTVRRAVRRRAPLPRPSLTKATRYERASGERSSEEDLRCSRSCRERTLLVSPSEQRATHLDRVQAEELAEAVERKDGLLPRRLNPFERLEVDLSLFSAESDFLAERFDPVCEHGPEERELP